MTVCFRSSSNSGFRASAWVLSPTCSRAATCLRWRIQRRSRSNCSNTPTDRDARRSYDRPVGLFRRREANNAHVVDADLRPHSHVALAPEDVEASKRCKPLGDLADFAAERGLTFGGSIIVGAF